MCFRRMRGVHFQFLKFGHFFEACSWQTPKSSADLRVASKEFSVRRVVRCLQTGIASWCPPSTYFKIPQNKHRSSISTAVAPVPLSDRSSTKRPHRPSPTHCAGVSSDAVCLPLCRWRGWTIWNTTRSSSSPQGKAHSRPTYIKEFSFSGSRNIS